MMTSLLELAMHMAEDLHRAHLQVAEFHAAYHDDSDEACRLCEAEEHIEAACVALAQLTERKPDT
jgi:hypothetical protein